MDNEIKPEDVVSVKAVRLDVLKLELAKRKLCNCFEPSYEVDTQNRIVTCQDCGAIVDPFDALVQTAWQHDRINRAHERMLEERESIAGYKPHLKVFKALESRYRSDKYSMVPQCPRCSKPFDFSEITR